MDSTPVCTANAALAQPVEHIIRNDGVACSSHASGTSPFKELGRERRRKSGMFYNSRYHVLQIPFFKRSSVACPFPFEDRSSGAYNANAATHHSLLRNILPKVINVLLEQIPLNPSHSRRGQRN